MTSWKAVNTWFRVNSSKTVCLSPNVWKQRGKRHRNWNTAVRFMYLFLYDPNIGKLSAINPYPIFSVQGREMIEVKV